MSYRHVQRLVPVRSEFAAAQAALAYLRRSWRELSDVPEMRHLSLPHVREAADRLEATYTVRLFSEFEALFLDHLAERHPGLRVPRTTEALINRVALRERIPDLIRDGAQGVRDYRNSIVHHRPGPTSVLSFRRVTSALNQFVALLLDSP